MYLVKHDDTSWNSCESFSLYSDLEKLKYGSFEERWAIAKVLVRYGQVVIQPLSKVILNEGEDLEYRWFALKIVSQLSHSDVIVIITQLLTQTEDEDLMDLATQTLASQGEMAISILIPLLDSPDSRLSATQALSQIPHRGVIEPLLSVVDDDDLEVRLKAIATLSHFEHTAINPVLENALVDHNSRIRKEALTGLTQKTKYYESQELIPLIVPLLDDIDLSVCQQAVMCLSRIDDGLATNVLFNTLIQPYTPLPLQLTIVKALGWQETHHSIHALEKALYLVNQEVICSIIATFSRASEPEIKRYIVNILLKFYRNSDHTKKSPEIIQNLCYTWQKMNFKESINILQEIIALGDEKSKIYAESALKQLNKIA